VRCARGPALGFVGILSRHIDFVLLAKIRRPSRTTAGDRRAGVARRLGAERRAEGRVAGSGA